MCQIGDEGLQPLKFYNPNKSLRFYLRWSQKLSNQLEIWFGIFFDKLIDFSKFIIFIIVSAFYKEFFDVNDDKLNEHKVVIFE